MRKKMIGAIFLVAGVAIGSGMLGMPIMTGFIGFIPALCVMIGTWAFLLFSGFLMADVQVSMAGEVNVISMSEKTWGIGGKILAWIVNLFLLYALDVAFMAAGGKILGNLFPSVPPVLFPFLIALPLGWILFSGMQAIDRANRILVFCKLILGYGILVCFMPTHVKGSLLTHVDFAILPFTLPIVVQAFGFHTVIPSIVNYLERDVAKVRFVLMMGTLIALIVYAVWELLVLGIIPLKTLSHAYSQGDVATTPLIQIVQTPLIATGAIIFALCGIGTAFLGVTLGLMDSLFDGLKLQRDRRGKGVVGVLALLPPLAFVYVSPSLFLTALGYAGTLVALLYGIIPICMAWKLEAPSYWKSKRGRILLAVGLLFFGLTIGLDLASRFGYLTPLLKGYLE